MDSVTVFDALIKTIESSNLNYCINKTPFSAKISLKSTFIKRFDNDQTLQSDQLQLNLTEKLNSQEKKIFMLEREMIGLQKENIKVNLSYILTFKSCILFMYIKEVLGMHITYLV